MESYPCWLKPCPTFSPLCSHLPPTTSRIWTTRCSWGMRTHRRWGQWACRATLRTHRWAITSLTIYRWVSSLICPQGPSLPGSLKLAFPSSRPRSTTEITQEHPPCAVRSSPRAKCKTTLQVSTTTRWVRPTSPKCLTAASAPRKAAYL